MISAIKESQVDSVVDGYEKLFLQTAQKFRMESDRLVNVNSFCTDEGVRPVIRSMLRAFKAKISSMQSDECKNWLMEK